METYQNSDNFYKKIFLIALAIIMMNFKKTSSAYPETIEITKDEMFEI